MPPQKNRHKANNNLLTTQNSSSSKNSNKIIDSNIITQQGMASDRDTSSTDTTEDKDTEDTNSSNTPCAYKQHKRPKLLAIKTTNVDHVIPKLFETTNVKEIMKPDPIHIRRVVYLHLLKILTK